MILKELTEKLADQFDVRVCVQTISRHLDDGLAFNVKELRTEVTTDDSDINKQKRKDWVYWNICDLMGMDIFPYLKISATSTNT